MSNANHLINALAAQDKDEANSAFESMIQDRIADFLEVRKVELASTIMGDLQEGEGMDAQRRWTRQVAAVVKANPVQPHGKKASFHRGELKDRARKYFNQFGGVRGHGAEFVERGADAVRGARQTLKAQGKLPGLRKEEALDEVLQAGSAPSNAKINSNVLTNIRRAVQTLRVKGVNPTIAAAGHRDFGKLAAKNPKAPGYMLLRKLAPNKAQAVQSLTQAGVPLGGALEAHPNDFNQALQRIKRFK